VTEPHTCCDQIVRATADIEAIEIASRQTRVDTQKWRDDHEQRQAETVNRLFATMENNQKTLAARLDTIEDKLANRLPPWATLAFTAGGTCIGILVTIVVFLSQHFIR